MVPPHGLQVKPFFKGFASLNLPAALHTARTAEFTDVV